MATLIQLSPLPPLLTFQCGSLPSVSARPSSSSTDKACLKGEVTIKHSSSEHSVFRTLELAFTAREMFGNEEVLLAERTSTLWENEEGGTPPSSITWEMDALTDDLPHCLHLSGSSLTYTLTATLRPLNPSVDASPTSSSPVHLLRSLPSSSSSLLSPSLLALAHPEEPPSITVQTASLDSPIHAQINLKRNVFHRSEPVEVGVRIEVPSAEAVERDGLRLRTVEAELVRRITRRRLSPSEQSEQGSEEDEITTVLAHSGKSARFSPTRPIILRLLLHPPSTISCESITQSTILHTISFYVRVTISLITPASQGGSGRSDLFLQRTIYLVPDPVGSNSHVSAKLREVERERSVSPPQMVEEGWMPEEGPVPSYDEPSSASHLLLSATSSAHLPAWAPPIPSLGTTSTATAAAAAGGGGGGGQQEEEYDGYEELSATLSARPPPPGIDEDCSPPDAEAPSSRAGEATHAREREELAACAWEEEEEEEQEDHQNLMGVGSSGGTGGTAQQQAQARPMLPPPLDLSLPPPRPQLTSSSSATSTPTTATTTTTTTAAAAAAASVAGNGTDERGRAAEQMLRSASQSPHNRGYFPDHMILDHSSNNTEAESSMGMGGGGATMMMDRDSSSPGSTSTTTATADPSPSPSSSETDSEGEDQDQEEEEDSEPPPYAGAGAGGIPALGSHPPSGPPPYEMDSVGVRLVGVRVVGRDGRVEMF